MEDRKLTFRRGDFLAVAAVLLLAAAVFLAFLPQSREDPGVVQVYRDGVLIRELPLDTDVTLEISGVYTNTLQIRDGKAAMIHSDCPGADCVHSGAIKDPGRSIVCLPNRVELRIVGDADVDFVVR